MWAPSGRLKPCLLFEFWDRRWSWWHLIALDDAITLLGAVARQWLADARDDPHELELLADWLGIRPAELTAGRPAPASAPRRCHVCGRLALPGATWRTRCQACYRREYRRRKHGPK